MKLFRKGKGRWRKVIVDLVAVDQGEHEKRFLRQQWFRDAVFTLTVIVFAARFWADHTPDQIEVQWAAERDRRLAEQVRAKEKADHEAEAAILNLYKTVVNVEIDELTKRLTNSLTNSPSQ